MLERKDEILNDNDHSSCEDIIATLEGLRDEWKIRTEANEKYTEQTTRLQQEICEREKLRAQFNDESNKGHNDEIQKRLEELEQGIALEEEVNESLKEEVSYCGIEAIEAKIRTLSRKMEMADRIQLSSSLRYLLWNLNRSEPFILIQPVQEKCRWNDVWTLLLRYWRLIYSGILFLDLLLFLFLRYGFILIISSLCLNLLLATRLCECCTPSNNGKFRLILSVLKMLMQCIWLLVTIILKKGDLKYVIIFVSCK